MKIQKRDLDAKGNEFWQVKQQWKWKGEKGKKKGIIAIFEEKLTRLCEKCVVVMREPEVWRGERLWQKMSEQMSVLELNSWKDNNSH